MPIYDSKVSIRDQQFTVGQATEPVVDSPLLPLPGSSSFDAQGAALTGVEIAKGLGADRTEAIVYFRGDGDGQPPAFVDIVGYKGDSCVAVVRGDATFLGNHIGIGGATLARITERLETDGTTGALLLPTERRVRRGCCQDAR